MHKIYKLLTKHHAQQCFLSAKNRNFICDNVRHIQLIDIQTCAFLLSVTNVRNHIWQFAKESTVQNL